MMRDFITCLEFLTRIRFSNRTDWRDDDFAKSVPYFPLVGLVMGVFMGAVNYGLLYVNTPLFMRAVLLILAGALKDSHLAYLVGEKTYGKGSVQQVVPLSNTEGIKITMARYYSPSDTNIDKIGIPADLEVKNIEIKPEEEQTYTDLYNSGILPEIATENPNMTETEIAAKAKELAKTYPIEERLLRRLIRVQLPNSASIVYDLDYDNQLQAALDVLKTKDFDSLLKSTKSLKELQEEAKQKDENGKVVATK